MSDRGNTALMMLDHKALEAINEFVKNPTHGFFNIDDPKVELWIPIPIDASVLCFEHATFDEGKYKVQIFDPNQIKPFQEDVCIKELFEISNGVGLIKHRDVYSFLITNYQNKMLQNLPDEQRHFYMMKLFAPARTYAESSEDYVATFTDTETEEESYFADSVVYLPFIFDLDQNHCYYPVIYTPEFFNKDITTLKMADKLEMFEGLYDSSTEMLSGNTDGILLPEPILVNMPQSLNIFRLMLTQTYYTLDELEGNEKEEFLEKQGMHDGIAFKILVHEIDEDEDIQ